MGYAIGCMNGPRSFGPFADRCLGCAAPRLRGRCDGAPHEVPSAVSNAVRTVEDRLGIPLFARTTRSVSLTEAGARFVAGVEPALTDIGQTVDGLTAERGEVTGLLRIDSPLFAFEMALPPILAKLAQEHPRLTVEVRTGQMHVDIVAQGFDAGIRNRRWIHQDMVTVRLTGPYKNILVASARLSRCQRRAEVDR